MDLSKTMNRTASTPRGLTALLLSLALVLPSPAAANPEPGQSTLRVSQPEAPGRKAGLEESLQEGAPQPDPELIGALTQLARTLSGNYQLTLVPWEPISPGDWPQWRVIPRLGLFQYVPEDFSRFSGEAVIGLPLEAIALASTFRVGAVDREHRDHAAAWALMTVMAIARARAAMLATYSGVNVDFVRMDEVMYRQVEQDGRFPAQSSAFLQFLERVLYEERRGREGPRAPSVLVRELLEKTRDLRRRMRTLDSEEFYTTFRDHLWPVAVELLAEEMKQILFEQFQKEEALRQPLRLGRRQKLLAWQGRLALHELSAGQRARLEPLLKERLERLAPEERAPLKRTLQRRLSEGLQRMRPYLGTGAMPPALADRPPSAAEILFLQRRIRVGAEAAAALADRAIAHLDQIADGSTGLTAGLEETWRTASGFAQQLHEESRRISTEAGQTSAGSQELPERIRTLGLADLQEGEKLVELASKLGDRNQGMAQTAARLESEAGQFLGRVRTAQEKSLSEAERAALLQETKQLRAEAVAVRERVQTLQGQAEEGEMIAWEMMAQARTLAEAQSAQGRLTQSAQAIIDWADPGLSQRRAVAEALAEMVVRVLERLREMRQEQGEEGLDEPEIDLAVQEELTAMGERVTQMLKRLGVPEDLLQQWKQAAHLDPAQVREALEGAMQAASRPGWGGPDGGVYDLIGADLLRVTPPADPGEGAPAAAQGPEPELPAYGPRPHAADWDWRQRQQAARAFQVAARKQRAGIVEAQLPLYRKYRDLRQSLISTARAHLFQGLRMAQRRAVRTDLLEGEVDPDNLALAKTGTRRIFMEEAARGKEGERLLSLVVDVSGSMLGLADRSDPKSKERKIDYVLDLLVTLAEAASRVKNLKLQVTIFSSWMPNASVVIKRFDEPWTEAKATQVIDQILNSDHGGTNDAAAAEEEAKRMREAAGRGAQMMLWMLTDGEGRGAAAMQEVMLKNRDIQTFGWGLAEGMGYVKKTFGPRGILIPRMADLVREGLFVLNREIRKPIKPWAAPQQSAPASSTEEVEAGLEERAEGLEMAEDGLPLEFPRLHPVQDKPGAGPLELKRGVSAAGKESVLFEVDGLRIDPPAFPKVTLSPWAVGKLQEMWDVYRMSPKDRHGNLLLYGQAGVGKSLYARYLWEVYRGWLRANAARMGPAPAGLKRQLLAMADQTQTRVVTFNEGLRKADLAERLHLGESKEDETGWTPSDIVEGGRVGDQVILSEINRAPDELLAELDEPLSRRQKTLHAERVRFHPNARFVAAINPSQGQVAYQLGYQGRELSGQMLGHFTKVIIDYPRAKLPDGSDNPEHALFLEHEKQVLREVRKRKLADGSWAVPDSVIDGLVLLADLVREDAYAGQAPFIVTTRALVRMVERLDRFPHLLQRIPDVFFNAYWADDSVHGQGRRAHLMNLLERLFKPGDWPPADPWPAPRLAVGPPQVVTERAGRLQRSFLTYPHWPADVRIPLASGAGPYIPTPVFFETQENLRRLEELLMDAELKQNILNMGDSDTGQSYFMEVLAKALRRNLIVLTMSQGFKVADMLVMRWYSGGKTLWKDSLPLSSMRPDKVLKEGPPIVLWDRGEKGDPGVLAAFNDFLQERRVRLASGEEFLLPEGTLIALNRTPPRPPYEFLDQSAEWWDRFSHHAYEYPSEESELEILHAYHPGLARGSVRQVVKAGGVLRRLHRQGELFEPPGMGMTFAAAALMAQRPGTPVGLADLMIRAYGPLKEGESQAIRKGLKDAGLDVKVHPDRDPDLAALMAAFPLITWQPEVQRDPALWGQAGLLTLVPGVADRVAQTGQPAQVGWGLLLRGAGGGWAEMVPLEVGLERPFEPYAHLARAMRAKALEETVARFRFNTDGIFYQTAASEAWLQFEAPSDWTGLWDLLSHRRFHGRVVLTVEIPPEEDAAWNELAWLLDPVTLRRNVPVARRVQGISRPVPLKVTWAHLLPHLRGFSVGADAKDPADAGQPVQAGFLIRSTSAGLEEADLVRKIPVLAGFIPHGDDEESFKLMDGFEKRWDTFLKQHPAVKHLVVVQEVGTPFLAQVLWNMGLPVGQLVAAARDEPDGVERVVRPAFEQAMEVIREVTDGWWSQLHAGELPRNLTRPHWKKFFEVMLRKQQQGYELHRVVEDPSFETWWQMTLYQDGHVSLMGDLPQFEDPVALHQRYVGLLKLRSGASLARDESVVNRQLVPLLESVFEEEEPEDVRGLEGKPLEPEQVAVAMLRGSAHAIYMEPLLQARFAEVEPVRSEQMDPATQFSPGFQYEELVFGNGYPLGGGPPEVEQLVDDELAQMKAEIVQQRQEMTQKWVRTLRILPEYAQEDPVAQLQAAGEVIAAVRGVSSTLRLTEAAQGIAPPAAPAHARLVVAQNGLLPEQALQGLSERFGQVQPLPEPFDAAAADGLAADLKKLDPAGPKALVVAAPEAAELLRASLAQVDPDGQVPALILEVPAGMLNDTNPDALLTYLLGLLAEADPVPGLHTQRLEGTLGQDAWRRTLFLTSRA